jgi:hypothetical protein
MLQCRTLKKDFKYRGLGGKSIQIEFQISKKEIEEKAFEGNWACYNFMDRRDDFISLITNTKFYYGKIDGLGYVVCEDELEK